MRSSPLLHCRSNDRTDTVDNTLYRIAIRDAGCASNLQSMIPTSPAGHLVALPAFVDEHRHVVTALFACVSPGSAFPLSVFTFVVNPKILHQLPHVFKEFINVQPWQSFDSGSPYSLHFIPWRLLGIRLDIRLDIWDGLGRWRWCCAGVSIITRIYLSSTLQ